MEDKSIDEIMDEMKPVNQEEFNALIDSTKRIVVREVWSETTPQVLFDSTNKEDIQAFKESVQVLVPEEFFYCMCPGNPAIDLYDENNRITNITNHHGFSIRCDLWDGNAGLVDYEKWLQWFDERGIVQPRREVEEMEARELQFQKDYTRWMDAMPLSIRELWDDCIDEYGEGDISILKSALANEFKEEEQQIFALFSWYGSGATGGGSPAYEQVPKKMLYEYSVGNLLRAIEPFEQLSGKSLLEGIARFFGNWTFSQQPPEIRNLVPPELKRVLWLHFRETSDEEKLLFAREAFFDPLQ